MLKIKNASKTYSKQSIKAVDGLNLELKPGEIFGFLGPNGAGKTTTIKMVTGILEFEEGQIEVCGIDIKRDSIAAKLNIGYVSDNHVLYDKLSGREYINFMADVYGVDNKTREQRAGELLRIFDLERAFDSPISSYSHGMKQKISIIGAIIHNPKLWILDEPLLGLDPQSAFELKKLMRSHCDKGNTVFFSTHILEVAEKLCDRVGMIVKSKLSLLGDMEQIKRIQGDTTLEELFLKIAGGH
ncbi:MAG: ABC transporter ATP-binding protein [Firmicutes bacterium]|nr:ABC transporter ATP-binding protein [Bacillota bacterium]